MVETFKLYHNNPNVKTLEEFCQISGVHFDDKYKLKDFFEDNRQNILNQMDNFQKVEYISENGLNKKVVDLDASDLKIDMTLPCPLTLVILKRLVTYTIAEKQQTIQEPVFDTVALQDAQIRSSCLDDNIRFSLAPFVRKERMACSVVGFFKTMYYNKQDSSNKDLGKADGIYQMSSNFINISDYIFQLNTSVGQQGGSFSFSLPHVPFYRRDEENLHIDNSFAMKESDNVLNRYINGDFMTLDDFNETPVVKSELSSMNYFSWLISKNDLIFISFNEVDPSMLEDDNIAGNSFDMIGLVDNVSLSKDSQGNITVNVSGKDLMKLLSDDSSIYFPNATTVNQGNFFDNIEGALRSGDAAGVDTTNGKTKDNPMRMPSTGSIKPFNEECNGFTIDYIIKVVIKELTNTQICPSEIFSSWKERRTKFVNLTPKNK